jgi:hypothetical protein
MYNGSQHRVNPITVTDNSKIHMKKNIAIVFTMGLAIASLSLLNGCCTKAAASSKPKPAMVASVGPTASDCGPSIVGPLGPLGPQGPVGPVGSVGAEGPAGDKLLGAVGRKGPVGPVGQQGPQGPVGPAGAVVAGSVGPQGPLGPLGPQGDTGDTGAKGASALGAIGVVGPVGPQGPVGPEGGVGPVGPTLVGPAGNVGPEGPVGPQGPKGAVGSRGNTMPGVIGSVGTPGDVGPVGPQGVVGPVGPAGVVTCWTYYREFGFGGNQSAIATSDGSKAAEVASFLKRNPSLTLGIDGTSSDQTLSANRVNVVREALLKAGVPAAKVQVGTLADPRYVHPHDGRVVVLFHTN